MSAQSHHTRSGRLLGRALLAAIAIAVLLPPAFGQSGYFGRNKVQYEKFDYQILKTEHFDVYFYPEEKDAIKIAAQMAERWYKRYSRLMSHDLRGRQVLIMYASHPQFEQTTVLPELINEAMGGVTESTKRRIILPFGGSLDETDHVIGHELVHAFQYDIAAGAVPNVSQQQQGGSGIERAPLWVVEGAAEYFSIGPVDPHTAMWMRDMVVKKKLPTIKDLRDENTYFPYRYGQAVWAYIAGRWGDIVAVRVMKDIIRGLDYEKAIEKDLNIKLDVLSKDWHEALKKDYFPIQATTVSPTSLGRLLVKGTEQEGLNVAPALSPDGKRFMFLSSRDLFSIELYMSDAKNGKILQKVTKTAVDNRFQSIEFINSAGSWDADGKRFVFGAVSAGKPVLAFLNAETEKLQDEIRFSNLGEILNPTWSPDGKRIAFSALAGGFSDIYIYNLETKELKNMTSDPYGDLQPAWSPDGRRIAFVTERFTTQLNLMSIGSYQLALLDPETGEIKQFRTFAEGKNINPQWSADSKSLFFVSDQNGISNVYRTDMASGAIRQVTNLYTGASGITHLSPTLSIASKSNDLLYSVYADGNYSIYTVEPQDKLTGAAVEEMPYNTTPAVLSPRDRQGSEVLGLLKSSTFGLPDASKFTETPYKPKLSLDYVAPPSVGVGYDRYYGAYGGGGVALFWSDMLGYYNLMTMAQVSNRLEDSQAMVAFLNSKNRLNWGVVAQRLPMVYGYYNAYYDYVGDEAAEIDQEILYRQIFYEVGGFASYPFSQNQRFELTAAYDYIQFQNVVYESAYDYYTGYPIYTDERTDLPSPAGLHMVYAGMALVYDTAFFGATAPILGQSYRLEVAPTVGSINYVSILADYRKYIMPVKPFTLAFRFMHYGRYGKGAEDQRLYPMFLGYDWYVRGYDYNSFEGDTSSFDPYARLFGSKMMVANLELRFPLFGVLGIGKGFYGIFPVDAIAFYDAGMVWGDSLEYDANGAIITNSFNKQKPVSSAGFGLRVNVFGYLVLGLNYVYPFQRPGKGWYFQFSFFPGF